MLSVPTASADNVSRISSLVSPGGMGWDPQEYSGSG